MMEHCSKALEKNVVEKVSKEKDILKNSTLEKTMIEKAATFMKKNDHFLVISHLNPDGDATASSIAIAHLLQGLGKKFVVANEGELPQRFSFLAGFDHILNFSDTQAEQSFPFVISVDVADYERLGKVEPAIDAHSLILNIDHHPTNTMFGEINLIQAQAASTTEIIYDLVKHAFPKLLDLEMAEALYTGLLTDTGGFRYSNTTDKVLQMAADLVKVGVKPNKVAEYALETISASHIRLLRQSLHSLSFYYEEKVALISVSLEDMQQTAASKDDVDGLVAYPRNIEGVEVGVLLKQIADDEVKVSLRSKHVVDVAAIAQKNGGGGHTKASGYTFKGSLEEAKQDLIQQLTEVLPL